jgi:cytochrome c
MAQRSAAIQRLNKTRLPDQPEFCLSSELFRFSYHVLWCAQVASHQGEWMGMKSRGLWGGAALLLMMMALGALMWPRSTPDRLRATHLVGEAAAGQQAFVRCAECHQIGPSARSGFGPQLNGVLGRIAGSTRDYQYSSAMKQSGMVWSEQNMAAFLRSPASLVPGTKMIFWGLSDEQEIADLLAYLRTQ